MRSVKVTNLLAVAIAVRLPDGGNVPASSSRTFTNVDDETLELARPSLDALVEDDTLTYQVLDNDGGPSIALEYRVREVTWTHADFVAATQTEAISDTFVFPAGSRLEGFSRKNDVVFAATSLVDLGFTGATDVLEDGQILTALTEVYGAGSNALPLIKRDIAGKSIAGVFDAGSGNTTAGWSAGSYTARVYYSVPA